MGGKIVSLKFIMGRMFLESTESETPMLKSSSVMINKRGDRGSP